jgi:2-keto-3-deoxy-galactonokinase
MKYFADGLAVVADENGLAHVVATVPSEQTAQVFADVLNRVHQNATSHMFITVEVRNNYGNDLVYPADATARLFAALIGQKTFSARHISALRTLGYTMHVAAGKLPQEFQPV